MARVANADQAIVTGVHHPLQQLLGERWLQVSEELQSKVRIRGIPKEDIHTPRLRRDLGSDLAAAGWPTAAPEALG